VAAWCQRQQRSRPAATAAVAWRRQQQVLVQQSSPKTGCSVPLAVARWQWQ